MASSLDTLVEQCHDALGQLIRGDATAWAELFSTEDDVSLGNPFGPFVSGFQDVIATARSAADRYRDGELIGFERIGTHKAQGLACIVEVESFRARVGDSTDMWVVSLRVTTVFRVEGEEWKLVHRHADPITTPRSPESVIGSAG
jgi:hypothetical protein